MLKPASRRKSARLSVPGSRPVRSCAPHRRTSSNRPKARSPTVRVPASQWRTARGVTPTASASCSTLMSLNSRWRCRAWGRRDCAIPEAKRSEQFTATVHDGAILIPAKAVAGNYRPELGAIAGRPSGRARSVPLGRRAGQRRSRGARQGGEVAPVFAVVGHAEGDRPRNVFSSVDASVHLGDQSTSAVGRRLPKGMRPEIAPGLEGADRDLAIRLLTRPEGAPWWSLKLYGSQSYEATVPAGRTTPLWASCRPSSSTRSGSRWSRPGRRRRATSGGISSPMPPAGRASLAGWCTGHCRSTCPQRCAGPGHRSSSTPICRPSVSRALATRWRTWRRGTRPILRLMCPRGSARFRTTPPRQ
ncbi:hypothetical protein SHL15_6179 [Streptomyces hygroscopicus subsp. limoneus]|nr:hypothetical protein SHL15_6179 [Streptomyces hygroscopicus subsp. limoneus]